MKKRDAITARLLAELAIRTAQSGKTDKRYDNIKGNCLDIYLHTVNFLFVCCRKLYGTWCSTEAM